MSFKALPRRRPDLDSCSCCDLGVVWETQGQAGQVQELDLEISGTAWRLAGWWGNAELCGHGYMGARGEGLVGET